MKENDSKFLLIDEIVMPDETLKLVFKLRKRVILAKTNEDLKDLYSEILQLLTLFNNEKRNYHNRNNNDSYFGLMLLLKETVE